MPVPVFRMPEIIHVLNKKLLVLIYKVFSNKNKALTSLFLQIIFEYVLFDMGVN